MPICATRWNWNEEFQVGQGTLRKYLSLFPVQYIFVVFVYIKFNMVSPTIPARNALPSADALVHLPFNQVEAEPLVEVGPAIVVVTLGRGGFVIVKAVELVMLCAAVGVVDAFWLERVIPGSNEVKFAGGSVDYIKPHQPLPFLTPKPTRRRKKLTAPGLKYEQNDHPKILLSAADVSKQLTLPSY
jgi:hypothetical protein